MYQLETRFARIINMSICFTRLEMSVIYYLVPGMYHVLQQQLLIHVVY